MTIESYLVALALTLIIEVSVAYILGFRNAKSLISVVCVNFISHPIFGYFLWINEAASFIVINSFSIVILEVIITIIEALLLFFALKQKFKIMLGLSLAINFTSFVIGLIIFRNF
jgi:hypothetical protein